MSNAQFTWISPEEVAAPLPEASGDPEPRELSPAQLQALFEKAREGDAMATEIQAAKGFMAYAAWKFDEPDSDLTEVQRSFLFDEVAPAASTGLDFVDRLLSAPSLPEDMWTYGISKGLEAYLKQAETQARASQILEGFLGRGLATTNSDEDWNGNRMWRDLMRVAMEHLPAERLLPMAQKASKALPKGAFTAYRINLDWLPALHFKINPQGAIDGILKESLRGNNWRNAMRWLVKLASHPQTGPLLAPRLVEAVQNKPALLKRDGVLAALKRSGADVTPLGLNKATRTKFDRAHEGAADVAAWLLEHGVIQTPMTQATLDKVLEERADVALDRYLVLAVLAEAGVGSGFDTESGMWIVPYGDLLRDVLVPCAPEGMQASADIAPDEDREQVVYTIRAALGKVALQVRFTDYSDYFDVPVLFDLFNRILKKARLPQRYIAIETGDQCTEFVCMPSKTFKALASRWGLKEMPDWG